MRQTLRQIVAVLALIGMSMSIAPTTFAASYSDASAANKLAAAGIIQDHSAKIADYRLGDNVLRQEAVGIAGRVSGVIPNSPVSAYNCQDMFSDISEAWVCRAAELAAFARIVNANNTTFRPMDKVTRYEAVVMALKASCLNPVDASGSTHIEQTAARAVEAGLISNAAAFNPNAVATRGDVFRYNVYAMDFAEANSDEMDDSLPTCAERANGGEGGNDILCVLDPSFCATEENTTTGGTSTSGNVSVSLASTNPAVSTLVAGSAAANLAEFRFVNNGNSEAKVTSVKLMRTGISVDTTLPNVYLYSGVNRLTDAATVSTGVITFNDPSGVITIPANSSKTVAVRADIAAGVSGQTVGVTLTSYTVGGTATSVSVAGNLHNTATVSGAATLDFNATTTPSGTAVDPQSDYTMWQNVVNVGNRDVQLKSIRLRQIGSVTTSDLGNFRLYVDGVAVGTAVATLDAQGYVTFDLSGAPVLLKTGSRTIKVLGDIIAGSSRTFSFSLRQAADVWATDTELSNNVLATANGSTFSARTSTSATINSGSLTFTKATNSPSGNTVNAASGVVLARYEVKAFGEAMKIENLSFAIDEDDTDTTYTLRNGAVFLDGVQIGSTAALAGIDDATQGYTNYTFGSSAIITPGTTRILEVRADIYNSDGTNDVVANDTIQARIVVGSSNVQRLTSLGYGSYPAAIVTGNTLTVATGALTVAKDTSYANNTTTVPKSSYLVGRYNIQANTTEGANITSVVVDFDTVADAFDASDDLNNLWLKIGGQTVGAGGVKSSVTDSANTFSTNVNIAAGQTLSVEVYADVASGATDGDGTADTGISSITVGYTTTGGSSTSTTASEVTGQTITAGTGTFTTALDGSSPLNRIVAGNQEVTAAVYKFTASNETYTIKEIQVKVGSAAISSVISTVQLYDGATPIGAPVAFSQSSNTAALVTGLNVVVPANSTKTITAKLMLNTIGTSAGTSQSNAALSLDSAKYADSQGVETTDGTDRAGNELYVFKTIPTLAQVDLANGTLVNGQATDIYKFTVSASAQGALALKQIKLPVTWSDGGTADTLEVESLKFYENGVDITANVVMQDEDGNSVESTSGLLESDDSLYITWNSTLEGTVPAGSTTTYTVRGTATGFRATGADTVGDTVSLYLAGDASANGTSVYLNGTAVATIWGLHTAAAATGSGSAQAFIWSDNASSSHVADGNASSTGDWANGYKVLNLDLGGESWTK
ncbi:hypothetical protein E6Q11_00045 [Candidatus Dojkabacteria bacterium]|uniref:S-layer homology domain-containing protein n=1 Tax=Candidatus Dojkabacteria bacterium TaxID=2099670 RepID=A0A5C7JBL8_9BACT|nr:MAG: hypothetical protein E6Q11_00045 [Candidatus Dojkabacteria bacterium]